MVFDEKVAELYFALLEKAVKDKYRGHQDYQLILSSIREDFPMVGGSINIQKQDRNGNFFTVNYHVAVMDDLRNVVKGIDDLGGQCAKGEIVKKGFLFTCMECGQNFCRMHIKFVDNDASKPLCCYGTKGGCYPRAVKRYSDDKLIKIMNKTVKANVLTDYHIAKKKLKAVRKGNLALGAVHEQMMLPQQGRPLALGSGSIYSVRCGNPSCDESISFAGIYCPECRNTVTIQSGAPLNCPLCNEPVKQVQCPYCGSINQL